MRRVCLIAALAMTTFAPACVDGDRWQRDMALATREREQGRYEVAERALLSALAQADRLHRLHPYQLETNRELARLYFKVGAFDQAKSTLTRLVSKLEELFNDEHPMTAALHADLGRACDALGQFDEAESHYRRALPGSLKAPVQNELDYLYLDMAVNAAHRKRFDEAAQHLTNASAAAEVIHPGGPIFEEIRARWAALAKAR